MVYEDREIPYSKTSSTSTLDDQIQPRLFVQHDVRRSGLDEQKWALESDYAFLLKSYKDGMAYYGELKKRGELQDLTMSEFADVYRANRPYTRPECTLWKDILYGSKRQMFWYADPFMRFCLDLNQGGAMVDLRPYAAKLIRPCGVGTKANQDASYPFLVQSLYRAGFFTHYAGEGPSRAARSGTAPSRWIYAHAARWHPSRRRAIRASSRWIRSRSSLTGSMSGCRASSV